MQQNSVAVVTEAPSPADHGAEGYLPLAYLAPWAPRGVLCTMRRAEGDTRVEFKPLDAAGVALEHRDNELSPELKQPIEQQLGSLALAEPAAALRPILQRPATEWDAAARDNFARFIMSLLLLNPALVATVTRAMRDIVETGTREIQARYATKRSDPKTFAEYVTRSDPEAPAQAAVQYLQKVMNGETIAAAIGKMQWARISVEKSRFTLLASDRPLDIPLNLSDRSAYIALPLSPTLLFVASNNPGLLDTLARHDPSKVVRMMNLATVSQAHERVFSVDDSQFAFVKHHFGTARPVPLLSDNPRQEALAALKRRPER
jgi:Protein of unknown function (DUF4238)